MINFKIKVPYWIKRYIVTRRNDPVKHCNVYKDLGCSHVDGLLCDFPRCQISKDWNYIRNEFTTFSSTNRCGICGGRIKHKFIEMCFKCEDCKETTRL